MLTFPGFFPVRYRRAQQGLSLVELLVATAVGLLLTVWAISMFVSSLGNNRKLITEAQVNQNLRAAADLVTREVRRAGYWGHAIAGTRTSSMGSTTAPNPYSAIATTSATITYDFSRDVSENDTLDNNEKFKFQLSAGVIQMRTDATPPNETWLNITDPNTVTITAFTVTDTSAAALPLGNACSITCSAGTPHCPTTTVHSYLISITGTSTKDSAVTRTLETKVRARNDELSGFCPS
jgi:prepilin peptidase dependent protein B